MEEKQTPARVSPYATEVDLGSVWNADNAELEKLLHPLYGNALRRAPSEALISRGLPFVLGSSKGKRWLAVDQRVEVPLEGQTARYLVVLSFCDSSRGSAGERPPGVPVGWVYPVGEPLASLTVTLEDGSQIHQLLRRRYQVNEGIIGWGGSAFLAVPHRAEGVLDWRGPHRRLGEGRYAPAGHAGPLTVLPASWGVGQTGVEDHIPSPTDDLTLWLHAVELSNDVVPLSSIALEPIDGSQEGRLVVVAGLTLFSGSSSPLRWKPRRSYRFSGARGVPVAVDLGLVAGRRPLSDTTESPSVLGWGSMDGSSEGDAEEVIITAAEDARIEVRGHDSIPLRDLGRSGSVGSIEVRELSDASTRVTVRMTDNEGRLTPARVRFRAPDGRYLPPLGHRTEVNPGLYEDTGADLLVGGATFAYVRGEFEIDIPARGAHVELWRGFDVAPISTYISETGREPLTFQFDRGVDAGGWYSGDTHVHFLAPSTALLQAQAEGVNAVHLLATQWGEHFTNLTDFGTDVSDPTGSHRVWVGSENRQNMLGHVGLVGTRHPILPYASGGPPEAGIGGGVSVLMADWLRRAKEDGGLAVAAHFPLPLAEMPADIAAGLVDAIELQCFDPWLSNPSITEWYRYLNAGFRLPLVGGTDKMSAEIPLGQIRTYAFCGEDEPFDFGTWAEAIRKGRTFVTSGPFIRFRVSGQEVGSTIVVDAGATVEVEVVAESPQSMIDSVEVVLDGEVVASTSSEKPVRTLRLSERLRIQRTCWLAARTRSPYDIPSAFLTNMAAHTSPVFVEVPGRPRGSVDLEEPLAILEGTRHWLRSVATTYSEEDVRRFDRFLRQQEERLRSLHRG